MISITCAHHLLHPLAALLQQGATVALRRGANAASLRLPRFPSGISGLGSPPIGGKTMQADLDHIREIEAVSRSGVEPAAARGRDRKVVESWLRCLEKHSIDPSARAQAYILPDRELRQHRARSEELISIARSGIDTLYKLVGGQDYVLLLADAAGVAVEYLGAPQQKEALRQSGLFLGAEWSEARAGTCAVGTCIETGEALIVHQSDHFDVTHGGLSCTAAPIYDSRGSLAAVLDISLLSSPRPRASQFLALNLVQQAVRRIEMANIMAENRREWVLRLAGNPEFLDVDPEAALSLDGGGHVIGMTHSAARLMGRTLGADWRHPEGLIGRHVSEVFDIDFNSLEGLTRGTAARERVIETRDGYRLFAHAIEPRRSPPPTPALSARHLPARLTALANNDPTMTEVLKQAAALAPAQMPFLIGGETGTGKSTLARIVHDIGRKGPFVAVPCAALVEEEAALLFGREGTRSAEAGLIEAAAGGTLVFENIEELPLRLQARLLALLVEGTYRPLGAIRERRSTVRIIATSTADLEAEVSAGRLRRDLAARLSMTRLNLPALRDRRDILWLCAQAFARTLGASRSAQTTSAQGAVQIDTAASQTLAQYRWPGNLHDLAALSASVAALRDSRGQTGGQTPRGTGATAPITAADLPFALHGAAQQSGGPNTPVLLRQALEAAGWNISGAARRLGVDRSTVHRQMQRYGLRRP